MRRLSFIPVLALALFLPLATHAATVMNGQNVDISTSTPDNTYVAGGTIDVQAPLPQDLSAVGGTIDVNAPVGRDALLAAGNIRVEQPIADNADIAGGHVTIDNSVGGDLFAAGGILTVAGKANYLYLAGNNVDVTNGSNGTTTIYGVDVSIAGTFNGPVEVVASDKVSVAAGTVIRGAFKYNAPVQAEIPASAQITGGVNYIGNAPFLPTVKQAETFATAGLWIFFLVRITAALVVIGLVVGFFPLLTNNVIETALTRSPERFILLALLGFATFVATPVLIILLAISFVGIGLALLLGAAYFLFILFAYIYAAALAGSALLWVFRKRNAITWREALLGVVVLEIVGVIPYIGFIVKLVLAAAAGGALLILFYRFAFRRSEQDLLDI